MNGEPTGLESADGRDTDHPERGIGSQYYVQLTLGEAAQIRREAQTKGCSFEEALDQHLEAKAR